MEPLIDRLKEILEQLPDGQAHLEELPQGRVCGHVVSSAFEDNDYECRRRMIRDLLDQALNEGRIQKDEMLQVSTLLTYTPDEWAVNPIEQ